MKDKRRELLYRSFNEDLTQRDADELNEALEQSEELRNEQRDFLETREQLQNALPSTFAPGFANRVVQRLQNERSAEDELFSGLLTSFRRAALIAGLTMIGLLSYTALDGELSLYSLLGLQDASYEQLISANFTE
ncbi:MAG: hypothetical protein ACRBF0_18605 [Calditrichia bacterium]